MARILIAEDSPTQAERLRLILEAEGFHAEVAVDAESALARLEKSPFDMVISDIVMPGLSGYELCRTIKSKPEWAGIPVILLTTRRDPMDLFRGLECGADNFYTKPYDADRLIERIRNFLHNKALRSQGKLKVGIEISMFGKTFVIDSGREQILDLLISTFEDIVQTNLDLEQSKDDLAAAKGKIEEYVRLLEGRVQSSEEKYRAIVDGVAEGIIALDDRGAINSINPSAQKIFGYTVAEVLGKDVRVLIPESRLGRPGSIASYLRTGNFGDREGRRKDGTAVPIELRLSEVTVGDRRMFVAVIVDLTTKRQTERRLQQVQKMEAVGQLAGGVSHDFNNLLSVIVGNLDLLREGLEHDAERSALVDVCLTAALRGADLNRSLLAFSRRQPLKPEVIKVPEVLERMSAMLRRTLGEQIEVSIRAAEDIWPAHADVAMLETSILNLCINARDAMPEGGKLMIEASSAVLDESYAVDNPDVAPGDYVVVAVSDSGTGIPPEILNRVFEPFFTTKPEGKGTGLGLSMIYGFARQSGGHVRIYSELGSGTTVRLFLPRANIAADTGSASSEPDAPPMGRGETILVVEDNPSVRQTVLRQLKGLGYHLLEAEDGTQALRILESRQSVDLLFTDIVMPGGISGADLARQVRKLRPGMKIVLTSGFPDASASQHFDYKGEILLSKPYRRRDLASTIRTALDAKRQS